MNAADALKAWRKAAGLSLLNAAYAIGCDPSQLSKIERGLRRPGLEVAMLIEEYTGIDSARWRDGSGRKRKRAA
jgi:transcriptional regulator with XRE-family HTH domain